MANQLTQAGCEKKLGEIPNQIERLHKTVAVTKELSLRIFEAFERVLRSQPPTCVDGVGKNPTTIKPKLAEELDSITEVLAEANGLLDNILNRCEL